jgi:hypothetical protein
MPSAHARQLPAAQRPPPCRRCAAQCAAARSCCAPEHPTAATPARTALATECSTCVHPHTEPLPLPLPRPSTPLWAGADLAQGLQRDPSLAAAAEGDPHLLERLAQEAASAAIDGSGEPAGGQLGLPEFRSLLEGLCASQGTLLVDTVALLLLQVRVLGRAGCWPCGVRCSCSCRFGGRWVIAECMRMLLPPKLRLLLLRQRTAAAAPPKLRLQLHAAAQQSRRRGGCRRVVQLPSRALTPPPPPPLLLPAAPAA